ncbi:AAA family ATPase [Paenibacillus tyrfis]|uniref:AAA family ATPase n=1 Tax=Paenibacillus tyrfis TaxID=1501230 RepID=UPI00209C9A63|nr:AAA family ATPase [Paenibacillus tyrfis]MCP1307684.1 AAA family ATPase [Paenibacillus tyrfis]
MKLQMVRIQNFRKYFGLHEFDLSKEITIFYGPNGYGKSTFFDALEWCISGTIHRFSRQKDFSDKDVICFQCDEREAICSVEIDFANHKLARGFRVVDGIPLNMTVSVTKPDGSIIRGKTLVDQFLRRASYLKAGRTLVGDLIKQTHILSQDQITDFISHDDAKERFEALADIMGLKSVLSLLDNMKSIKSKLQSQSSKIEDTIQSLNSVIDKRREDLVSYDSSYIKKWSDGLAISSDLDHLQVRVPKIQEELLSRSGFISQKVDRLEILHGLGYSMIQECVDRKNELAKELELHNEQTENAQKLLTQVNMVIDSLSGDKVHYDTLRRLEMEEKECLEIIKRGSKNDVPDTLELTKLLSQKRRLITKHDTALLYIQEYQELERQLATIPALKQQQYIKVNKLRKRRERLLTLLSVVNNRLSHHANGSVINLVANVQNIFDYLKREQVHDGICPVCSVDHGDQLEHRIQESIQKHNENLKHYTTVSESLLSRKKRYETRLQQTEKEQKVAQDKDKEYELNLNNSNDRLSQIKQFEAFQLELFNQPFQKIQQSRELIQNEINNIEAAKQAIDKLTQVRLDLNNLKSTTGLSKVYTEKEAEARLQRFQRALDRINNYISLLNLSRDKIISGINSLNGELLSLQESVTQDEYEISLSLLISQHKTELQKLQEEYAAAAAFVQSISTNQRIQEDIQKLQDSQNNKAQEASIVTAKLAEIQTFLDEAGNRLGTTAKDMLNQSSSSIQKYFRYLNPMPITAPIRFEGDDDELKIMVQTSSENKPLSNVQYTLSSGQLNVLAISIFLAVNQSQRVSILDFVAIDDPIQNMDDVNQFSICDVLGTLSKQLFFATHDYEFVKLFIKKNEHRKDEIQVYIIDSPLLTEKKIKRLTFE